MTNKELITIFESTELLEDNIFDIYESLMDYEEEYQQLEISKIIPSIYDAYEIYCKHKNHIQETINYIMNEIDFSGIVEMFNLNNLLDQIPEEYKGVFGKMIQDTLEK